LTQTLSAPSPIFDYAVSQADNGLSLSALSADFGGPTLGLSDSQDEVADHLQAIWNVGGGSFGPLFGRLGTLADSNADDYEAALSDMTFGAAGAAAAGSIVMAQQHLDLLLSCPMFAPDSSFV